MTDYAALLKKKYGPLPGYAYAVVGTGALAAFFYMRKRSGSSSAGGATVPIGWPGTGGGGGGGGGGDDGGGTPGPYPVECPEGWEQKGDFCVPADIPTPPATCPPGKIRDTMGYCIDDPTGGIIHPVNPGQDDPYEGQKCIESGKYWTCKGTYPKCKWTCEDAPYGDGVQSTAANANATATAIYGDWKSLGRPAESKSVFARFKPGVVTADPGAITPVSLTADKSNANAVARY